MHFLCSEAIHCLCNFPTSMLFHQLLIQMAVNLLQCEGIICTLHLSSLISHTDLRFTALVEFDAKCSQSHRRQREEILQLIADRLEISRACIHHYSSAHEKQVSQRGKQLWVICPPGSLFQHDSCSFHGLFMSANKHD